MQVAVSDLETLHLSYFGKAQAPSFAIGSKGPTWMNWRICMDLVVGQH